LIFDRDQKFGFEVIAAVKATVLTGAVVIVGFERVLEMNLVPIGTNEFFPNPLLGVLGISSHYTSFRTMKAVETVRLLMIDISMVLKGATIGSLEHLSRFGTSLLPRLRRITSAPNRCMQRDDAG
jgi:hypothetical protein